MITSLQRINVARSCAGMPTISAITSIGSAPC
jgi:hypothetical protein